MLHVIYDIVKEILHLKCFVQANSVLHTSEKSHRQFMCICIVKHGEKIAHGDIVYSLRAMNTVQNGITIEYEVYTTYKTCIVCV